MKISVTGREYRWHKWSQIAPPVVQVALDHALEFIQNNPDTQHPGFQWARNSVPGPLCSPPQIELLDYRATEAEWEEIILAHGNLEKHPYYPRKIMSFLPTTSSEIGWFGKRKQMQTLPLVYDNFPDLRLRPWKDQLWFLGRHVHAAYSTLRERQYEEQKTHILHLLCGMGFELIPIQQNRSLLDHLIEYYRIFTGLKLKIPTYTDLLEMATPDLRDRWSGILVNAAPSGDEAQAQKVNRIREEHIHKLLRDLRAQQPDYSFVITNTKDRKIRQSQQQLDNTGNRLPIYEYRPSQTWDLHVRKPVCDLMLEGLPYEAVLYSNELSALTRSWTLEKISAYRHFSVRFRLATP